MFVYCLLVVGHESLKVYFDEEDEKDKSRIDQLLRFKCYQVSLKDPAVTRLFVQCRKDCGDLHEHASFGEGLVGIEIRSDSKGVVLVNCFYVCYL